MTDWKLASRTWEERYRIERAKRQECERNFDALADGLGVVTKIRDEVDSMRLGKLSVYLAERNLTQDFNQWHIDRYGVEYD